MNSGSSADYLELWIVGRAESVRLLKSRVIDAARDLYGPDAVDIIARDLIAIHVDNICFRLDCQSDGISISAPNKHEQHNPLAWNQTLTKFHLEIIAPVKDKIGAVASGVGVRRPAD